MTTGTISEKKDSILFRKANKKKRILMVAPPYRLTQQNFPLGLMYVGACLQRAGHHVEAIDMDHLNLPESDFARELIDRQYDYFCIGGMITAWNFIRYACETVKRLKPEVTTIVGGGVISSTPKSLMSVSEGVDIGVIGEGEEAALEIIEAIESGRSLSDVNGIVYREKSGLVIQTEKRNYSYHLDDLPFPAWDLFDVGNSYVKYPSHYSLLKAKRTATVYSTRGCPFMCSFCYTEKTVRQRSVQNVIEEIKELKKRFGVGHIAFADDLFVVRKKYVVEFCEEMIKQKIGVTWTATGRCNIVDPEFLKMMKAAGCEFLGLGIESGSSTVLRKIKKSQTPEQIVNAVRMTTEAGIRPGGSFILGLPPETKETVRETVDVYKQINSYRSHVNRFSFATPYPGTPLYDQMKEAGKIDDEIKFFETVSQRGDATDFLMNCTEDISDEELIQMKQDIEKEVFDDFMSKHPWYAFAQWLEQNTPWGKIHSVLMKFKMHGFIYGISFLWEKLLIKTGIKKNKYQKQAWHAKRGDLGYRQQQAMFEGQMPTY